MKWYSVLPLIMLPGCFRRGWRGKLTKPLRLSTSAKSKAQYWIFVNSPGILYAVSYLEIILEGLP